MTKGPQEYQWSVDVYNGAGQKKVNATTYSGPYGKETIYEYNDLGQLVKEVADEGRSMWGNYYYGVCNEYVYNEAGQQIEGTFYSYVTIDGYQKEIKYYLHHKYDEAGRQIKSMKYDADNNMESYTEYEYNEAGQLTKSTNYNADDSMESYTEYEYNEAGQLMMSKEFKNDSLYKCYIYGYNEAGQLTKYTNYDADGNMVSYTEYEYDDAGQRIGSTTYNPDGTIRQ